MASVMVDAGMDQQVHRFFGRGVEEPYDPAAAAQVDVRSTAARLIVVTHEHGDHVAGVIHSPQAQRAGGQDDPDANARCRRCSPRRRCRRSRSRRRWRRGIAWWTTTGTLPLAPGIALIKAAGHTPGSQMVYVALESGA